MDHVPGSDTFQKHYLNYNIYAGFWYVFPTSPNVVSTPNLRSNLKQGDSPRPAASARAAPPCRQSWTLGKQPQADRSDTETGWVSSRFFSI